MHRRVQSSLATTVAVSVLAAVPCLAHDIHRGTRFERIASIPVFLNTDVEAETVAEIIAATEDGLTLVYTDSETENLGFVDIADPYEPAADGVVALAGEPTSVAVAGPYALVAINTSESFENPSGLLQIVDIEDREIVRTLDLGGQPDSVAVSPDRRYAAIAIENERDEDAGDPPQAPPGFVVIVDLVGDVDEWGLRTVDLVGVPDRFPTDPEPEFVDINRFNVAVVTMQENNHVALIRLRSGRVIKDFSTGAVDLDEIDDTENALIELDASLDEVVREPDGVVWTSPLTFATADEGDLDGGSRGFTIFSLWGPTFYEAGNSVEHLVVRHGHYPEERSENKGNEPEGVEYGEYGRGSSRERFLFVGSERASVVVVYRLAHFPFGELFPQLVQVLPAGVGPEGLLALPDRDLFVVANEVDARDDKIRSTIAIYKRTEGRGNYPTVVSADRRDHRPIPWGALSGLASGGRHDRPAVYTIHDSFYRKSRIFPMSVRRNRPAVIDGEIVLNDRNGELLALLERLENALPGTDDFDPAALVNDDGTVNLDLEGVAVDPRGGFWLASEGGGNLVDGVSDPEDRPFTSPNVVVRTRGDGSIVEAISLPLEVVRNQFRFGLEGITVGPRGAIYVAFQRAWTNTGDPDDRARIGRYTPDGGWAFAHYALDAPESPNGGWVGNSEITHIGGGRFVVIERDNQGGPDAAVKRLYGFSIEGVEFKRNDEVDDFDVVEKRLVRDILETGDFDGTGGLVPEKLEGLTVLPSGRILIVNDNDGVDDSNGETQLLDLGRLFD